MYKKYLYFIILILLIFLLCCSDSSSNKPTPANVTLSNTNLQFETHAEWYADDLIWATGTASNSGQSRAYNIKVQSTLYDANHVSLGQSMWQKVLDTLDGGTSKGFTAMWADSSKTLATKCKYYKLDVQWDTVPSILKSDNDN